MTYFKQNAHRLFEGYSIAHAEYLTAPDYERAADMLADGMDLSRVLNYLRGWAFDYAYEANAETQDAIDFEARAY